MVSMSTIFFSLAEVYNPIRLIGINHISGGINEGIVDELGGHGTQGYLHYS